MVCDLDFVSYVCGVLRVSDTDDLVSMPCFCSMDLSTQNS